MNERIIIEDPLYDHRRKEAMNITESIINKKDVRNWYLDWCGQRLKEWMKDYVKRLDMSGTNKMDPLVSEPLFVIDSLSIEMQRMIEHRMCEAIRILQSLFEEQQSRIEKYKELLERDNDEREYLNSCIRQLQELLPKKESEYGLAPTDPNSDFTPRMPRGMTPEAYKYTKPSIEFEGNTTPTQQPKKKRGRPPKTDKEPETVGKGSVESQIEALGQQTGTPIGRN